MSAWVDKVSLQLENLTAAADSVLNPATSPNQGMQNGGTREGDSKIINFTIEELRSLVDQYSILNAVYTNKKKDYAKIKELVDSINEVGLKETSYTDITFQVSVQRIEWECAGSKLTEFFPFLPFFFFLN